MIESSGPQRKRVELGNGCDLLVTGSTGRTCSRRRENLCGSGCFDEDRRGSTKNDGGGSSKHCFVCMEVVGICGWESLKYGLQT